MDVDSSQKNVDRLARIRENQRKSRARKQEYVRELEQRLSSYKNEAQQKDIQHRLATQRLEAENRQLRALLGSLGISGELIQQYLQLAHQGAAVNQKVAIPAMQRPTESRAFSPSVRSEPESRLNSARTSASTASSASSTASETSALITKCPSALNVDPRSGATIPASTAGAPASCALTGCAPSKCGPSAGESLGPESEESAAGQGPSQKPMVLPQTQQTPLLHSQSQLPHQLQQPPQQPQDLPQLETSQSKQVNPPLCECSPGDKLPEDEGDLLNTTLCGMAEELINQYNTGGIDVDEIRKRLWAGFKAGAKGDGCRVENQILFQVLDEISNGI
ncbi:hypothetical protein PDE_02739 [Penicillium oxalicum 114-2]|uniref:BZIP domain-containing protein n=1 Tax=Penicillium oxalicum (strain 114-2 / CGMCC 5302) TaxID=933388 RepID=S7ZB19_PENO1|nr:hypothetical protein PDE_02739 [Penicillium oxalicum 114-2]